MTHALLVSRARRLGPAAELVARRRLQLLRYLEAGAFGLGLLLGLALMSRHGWRLGYPQWLSAKLGLVAFLLVPLEGFRLYLTLVWLGPGLRQTVEPPFSQDLGRAVSMDDMLQALAVPLLLLALPAVLWLSWTRPF